MPQDKVFALTASFQSPANQFLLGTALSITQQRALTVSKDTSVGSYWLAANTTQSIYESADAAGRASLVYVYVQAGAASGNTNSTPVDIFFVSGAGAPPVAIASLRANDWFCLPFKQNSDVNSPCKLFASASGQEAYISVLTAESGSI